MSWDSVIPPDLALQLHDTVVSVVGGIILVFVAGARCFGATRALFVCRTLSS